MEELFPALIRSIEGARLEAIHRLELRRPAVFALTRADVPIECHRACRLLGEIEQFLPRPQLRFDALAFGDVAHDGKNQVLAAIGNPGDGHLDRNSAPAAVQINRFERGTPVLLDPLANDPADLPADFRRLQIGHFHSEQFIARIAEERAGSLVDFDDVVAVVLQEYRVVGLLEEGPVALLLSRSAASLARSSSSACRSSVMSCMTPNWRTGRPDSSRVTSPWLCTTRTMPSGLTTRYSTS